MRRMAVAAAGLLLAGCAPGLAPESCAGADWRAVGVADGADGRGPGFVQEHVRSCAKVGVRPDAEAWEAGRREGLRSYCTPRNAWELGLAGRPLAEVCPEPMAAELARVHAAGWRRAQILRAIGDTRADMMFRRRDWQSTPELDMRLWELERLLAETPVPESVTAEPAPEITAAPAE